MGLEPSVTEGTEVVAGDIVGTVQRPIWWNTASWCPLVSSGRVTKIAAGSYTVKSQFDEIEQADGSPFLVL